MGDILALGMTHYPALVHPDERMAGLLRWTLEDPAIPPEAKETASWPPEMQAEYGSDGGAASAAEHRAKCVAGFRRLREELDAFRPDVVVIWGDDQYENFKEEIIPPFCIFAVDDMSPQPHLHHGADNVWGEPVDKVYPIRGSKEMGKYFASQMLEDGIDLSYAYQLRDPKTLPHAFMNSVMFLDYDRQGFPYPVVPFQVNCYGSYVIAHRGEPARFGQAGGELDPPGPSPSRAMQVGASFARAAKSSPWRVAVIGSSSWSHAFLHDKTWRLYPDIESDRGYYEALVHEDYAYWEKTTTEDLSAAGQQEMLNWFCLLGAVKEIGASPKWSELITTHAFNSSKCFAVFS